MKTFKLFNKIERNFLKIRRFSLVQCIFDSFNLTPFVSIDTITRHVCMYGSSLPTELRDSFDVPKNNLDFSAFHFKIDNVCRREV